MYIYIYQIIRVWLTRSSIYIVTSLEEKSPVGWFPKIHPFRWKWVDLKVLSPRISHPLAKNRDFQKLLEKGCGEIINHIPSLKLTDCFEKHLAFDSINLRIHAFQEQKPKNNEWSRVLVQTIFPTCNTGTLVLHVANISVGTKSSFGLSFCLLNYLREKFTSSTCRIIPVSFSG